MGPGEVTLMLDRVASGDRAAAEALIPLVYDELRRLSGTMMKNQPGSHTLQPTALVNEAFLKLIGANEGFANRVHFMAVASTAMRQILTDYARRKRAAKRGGGMARESGDIEQVADPAGRQIDPIALDDALTKLASLDPRRHRVVELRFFGGLTVDEVASLLDVSRSTVEADWRSARAWLAVELG
ncbi:MAG: sigma-70 family RNA polymerase sigma factor [Phycisphaerales bacterium]|nr:sigma-70 family RNA polymerase sigma factor [Phycisphaerales bacterium]